jgi:hypothetical protein
MNRARFSLNFRHPDQTKQMHGRMQRPIVI